MGCDRSRLRRVRRARRGVTGNEGLRLAGLKPGERFLDVAAGPGGLILPAARLGAKVLATDWSAAMIEFRSDEEMWNWVLGSNPIARTIVGDLPEHQQATVRQVLDGMLRERSSGNGPGMLTAPLNIGVGTK